MAMLPDDFPQGPAIRALRIQVTTFCDKKLKKPFKVPGSHATISFLQHMEIAGDLILRFQREEPPNPGIVPHFICDGGLGWSCHGVTPVEKKGQIIQDVANCG